MRGTGRSWNEVKGIAGDRNAWKLFMDGGHSTRSKRLDDDDDDDTLSIGHKMLTSLRSFI
jgi:hypothetical protein